MQYDVIKMRDTFFGKFVGFCVKFSGNPDVTATAIDIQLTVNGEEVAIHRVFDAMATTMRDDNSVLSILVQSPEYNQMFEALSSTVDAAEGAMIRAGRLESQVNDHVVAMRERLDSARACLVSASGVLRDLRQL